jgi:hypothetical protein
MRAAAIRPSGAPPSSAASLYIAGMASIPMIAVLTLSVRKVNGSPRTRCRKNSQ